MSQSCTEPGMAGPPAQEQIPLASAPELRFRGLKVCHVSPMERARDERAFSRESLPGLPYGLQPSILGPHSMKEPIEDVRFIPIPKSRSRAFRILLAVRIVHWALQQNADIYHVHSPEMIPAGLVLRLLYRKKVVYDTREDFPSMMLTKTYLPKRLRSPMSKMVARFERLAAQLVDGVITADPGTLRPLARAGKSRKLVFYNFPNLQYFPATAPAAKQFDLVYRGGLSERAGTFVLLQALQMLCNSGIKVRLLLFGYTDNPQTEQSIKDTLVRYGIQELVTLRGVIPHDEMASTMSLARIAVCPLQKIPKFMNNIPVKVFEAWACGLPVIATDLPPIRPFFARGGLGRLVKPGDPQDLANAIHLLLASPSLIEEYGRRARQLVVERYNAGMEVRKLLRLYGRVLAC
ncbi:MAG TPA: glycosyltransferase family 4 protein [Candidatus Sulfotelmatobacter sp.]|nr:glycosyltransferase family 4 protein [Candidatus Sulfotelmatobacter sp.]